MGKKSDRKTDSEKENEQRLLDNQARIERERQAYINKREIEQFLASYNKEFKRFEAGEIENAPKAPYKDPSATGEELETFFNKNEAYIKAEAAYRQRNPSGENTPPRKNEHLPPGVEVTLTPEETKRLREEKERQEALFAKNGFKL